MSSHRRYRIGTFKKYDAHFDRQKQTSPVLSPQNQSPTAQSLGLNNEQSIRAALAEWVGDKDGRFQDGEVVKMAQVPVAKNKIAEIRGQFDGMKHTAIREGKMPPTAMPRQLHDKFLIALAELDVCYEEVDILKKKLAEFEQEEEAEEETKCLEYGPKGSVKLMDGRPAFADGQKCSVDADGLPIISDDRSPYSGMHVSCYKVLVVDKFHRSRRGKNKHVKISERQLPDRPSDEEIERFHDANPELFQFVEDEAESEGTEK